MLNSVQVCLTIHLFAGVSYGAQLQPELPTEDPPVQDLHPMLSKVIDQGPFEPTWASLTTHPLPSWFSDSKIGLSAHWGPYAVPGWTPRKNTPYGVAYAEWYWQWLQSNDGVKQYHSDHYGDVAYDSFINGTLNLITGETDGFYAEDFDADEWMRLFQDAGVRYFFITVKHHDGFCLWDSAYTDRDAAAMGPEKDIYAELVDAARRHDIRIGLYYSFYEWFNPAYTGKGDGDHYAGFQALEDRDHDGVPDEYVDDFMIPQIKELIDRYQPDYLCFDGEWDHGYQHWRARQVVAYYYNQAAARGQSVVINDRFGQAKDGTSDTRGVYGDFYHVEYHADIDRAKPWAMWRGFGNSYGYNRNEHSSNILSVNDVIRMMVDVVSDNGNIEFNLGPRADGTIAEFEVERLRAMGRWLKVNGEAIYNTRKSPLGAQSFGRTTYNPETSMLYLHVYDWPTDGLLVLERMRAKPLGAYLLADPSNTLGIEVLYDDRVELSLPQSAAADDAVSVIAIEYEGELIGDPSE